MSETIYDNVISGVNVTSYCGPGGKPRVQVLDTKDGNIVQMDKEEWDYIVEVCTPSKFKDKIDDLKRKNKDMQSTVDSIIVENKGFRNGNDVLRRRHKELRNEVDALKIENEMLRGANKACEISMQHAEAEIRELRKENEALQGENIGEIQRLKKKNKELIDALAYMEESRDRWQTAWHDVTDRMVVVDNKNREIKRHNDNLLQECSRLKEVDGAHRACVAECQKENEKLKNTNTRLATAYNDFVDENRKLKEKLQGFAGFPELPQLNARIVALEKEKENLYVRIRNACDAGDLKHERIKVLERTIGEIERVIDTAMNGEG